LDERGDSKKRPLGGLFLLLEELIEQLPDGSTI